jgi:hypothetical protein
MRSRSGGSSSGTNDLSFSMRQARAIVTVIALLTVPRAALGQSPASERDAVLKTVQMFFDTMTAKDVEGARQVLQEQGRFHAMRMRDGKPDVRAFSNEEYFADLKASQQQMRERIWNPEVRISGLIASVWAPYDFWLDGKLSHCGVDQFDLIKTENGWKIAGGVYTLETTCAPSPLGPLKQ